MPPRTPMAAFTPTRLPAGPRLRQPPRPAASFTARANCSFQPSCSSKRCLHPAPRTPGNAGWSLSRCTTAPLILPLLCVLFLILFLLCGLLILSITRTWHSAGNFTLFCYPVRRGMNSRQFRPRPQPFSVTLAERRICNNGPFGRKESLVGPLPLIGPTGRNLWKQVFINEEFTKK